MTDPTTQTAKATPATTASEPIIVYGTPTCPMVPPVRAALNQSGAAYEYVDISRDIAARERVRAINAGNESVPTLVFPDGSTLTEPSSRELLGHLQARGYRVTWRARIAANAYLILMAGIIGWALLRFLEVL